VDASVGAQLEAASVGYWWHIYPPLDNAEAYEVVLGGLAAARSEYWAARAAHDDTAAAAALREIIDLTEVAAAMADGMAAARRRWLASDRPWPLSRVY
jgi:hypothetical protein